MMDGQKNIKLPAEFRTSGFVIFIINLIPKKE